MMEDEYNSYNREILSVEQTKERLLQVDCIKEELEMWRSYQ